MTRPRALVFLVVSLLLVTSLAARGGGIGLDDLIGLKELGFSEAEIRREVAKRGIGFELTGEAAARLRRAGFSEDLIRSLRPPAARPPAGGVTVESILRMLREERGTREILEALRGAGGRFSASPEDVAALEAAGAPPAVVLAVRGRRITVEDVKRLAPAGLEAASWRLLVDLVGVEGGTSPFPTPSISPAGGSRRTLSRP